MSVEIQLSNVSKKFKRDWIIKNLSYHFQEGSKTAILGSNGSGKSTLLKIICGFIGTSQGKVQWHIDDSESELLEWHHHFSYVAPYLELIEEFTLQETLDLHFSLKTTSPHIDLKDVLLRASLTDHLDKPLANYSSGMKQRVKLILGLCSEVDVYFLDEPCSNLDDNGIHWYRSLINDLPKDKILIVGSNSPVEYDYCENQIDITQYK